MTSFNFREYYVQIKKELEELHIQVEKVTPAHLVEKKKELERLIDEYEECMENYAIDIKTNAINERFRAYQDLKNKFKLNKKQIKDELARLGVKVSPGTPLSKLLRQDYLPFSPKDNQYDNIQEIRDGKRF